MRVPQEFPTPDAYPSDRHPGHNGPRPRRPRSNTDLTTRTRITMAPFSGSDRTSESPRLRRPGRREDPRIGAATPAAPPPAAPPAAGPHPPPASPAACSHDRPGIPPFATPHSSGPGRSQPDRARRAGLDAGAQGAGVRRPGGLVPAGASAGLTTPWVGPGGPKRFAGRRRRSPSRDRGGRTVRRERNCAGGFDAILVRLWCEHVRPPLGLLRFDRCARRSSGAGVVILGQSGWAKYGCRLYGPPPPSGPVPLRPAEPAR